MTILYLIAISFRFLGGQPAPLPPPNQMGAGKYSNNHFIFLLPFDKCVFKK